ncbi:hypothetical protein MTER_25320 [Mycolicibacter terrae]|uniref:Uncharacterized protein n=1 Tax=Mycolicibacter terrae TaxID=1788 RepID=A0AAD1HYV1_9MYCO|nr:hypothetical protein [Mycolicibacter terrae]ORW92491.1 hypothetical protein AWC28_01210 [Mycolicibacter terrae]BBX23121.1 hypothetical protein MTER_25320 [Mycolicibacter terrae]SNV67524.1 Uncharacterised protein [Mycolicibacter terrae]
MADITGLYKALLGRILGDDAAAPLDLRQAAFDNAGLDEPISTLIDKVALRSYRVTDDDVAAARSAGLSEDQIFEIVVCAAVGQATRQYTGALETLGAAGEGNPT